MLPVTAFSSGSRTSISEMPKESETAQLSQHGVILAFDLPP